MVAIISIRVPATCHWVISSGSGLTTEQYGSLSIFEVDAELQRWLDDPPRSVVSSSMCTFHLDYRHRHRSCELYGICRVPDRASSSSHVPGSMTDGLDHRTALISHVEAIMSREATVCAQVPCPSMIAIRTIVMSRPAVHHIPRSEALQHASSTTR